MSHTVKVIAGGFVLLGACIAIGAWLGAGMATGAKIFLPLWLVAAGVNLWLGVTKAGYSVAEEIPYFLVVFAVPAAAALFFVWRIARAS